MLSKLHQISSLWDSSTAALRVLAQAEPGLTGSPLSFTLKDLSTVRHYPERVWEWAATAMRVVEG